MQDIIIHKLMGGDTAVDDNLPETLKGIGASKSIASSKYQQMGPQENNVSAQTKPSRTPSSPEEHPDNFRNRETLPATPQSANTQMCRNSTLREGNYPMAKEMNRKMLREQTEMVNGYS